MATATGNDTRLTETDKIILKLDYIITKVKGTSDSVVDYTSVKDEFDKIRYAVNQKLSEVETLLAQRDALLKTNDSKAIKDRRALEFKVQDILDEVEPKLNSLDVTLKAQQKKQKSGKYGDIANKESIKELMDERFKILRSRLEGISISEAEIKENKSHLEQLEDILNSQSSSSRDLIDRRELYQEEKDKMDSWKKEIEDQDKALEGVHSAVKILRNEVKISGQHMENIKKNVGKVNKQADSTQVKIESQNKKLKNLLEKIRSGDRICVDIILICICLGLAAVLYNIVKKKYF